MKMNFKEKLNQITAFVFDVDGVLTDGNILLLPTGDMVRSMNTKDGYAMQLAVKKGYQIGIITGGKDQMVVERLKGLAITDVYLNSSDKIVDYDNFLALYNLKDENVMYMGDDIPDVPVLQRVGLPCCPKNSASEVRNVVDYVSPFEGGKGCVRDIIEQTLKAQGNWNDDFKTQSV